MNFKMKWMALVAILALAAACGGETDDTPATDSGSTTTDTGGDAGATDGGATTDSAVADGGGTTGDGGGAVDGGAAKDSGGSTKMQTCTEVGDCVIKACAPVGFKDGCTDACLAEGALEVAALQKVAPALSCVKEICLAKECKDSKDPKCLDECMGSKCLGPVLTCLDDGKTGDKPCPSIAPCMDACGLDKPNPFTCMNACVNSLDKKAKEQVNALAKCATDKGDVEMCFMETVACFTGGKTGDKPCGHMVKCMEECEKAAGKDGGETCAFKCLAEVDAEAQKLFGDIVAKGCPDKEDDPVCQGLELQCGLHKVEGDQKCYQINGCIGECVVAAVKAAGGKLGEKEMAEAQKGCFVQCLAKSTKKDQGLFLTLKGCMDAEDDKPCDKEGIACIDPSGSNSCSQTATCLGACEELGEDAPTPCAAKCLHEAKDVATAGAMNAAIESCEDGPDAKCVAAAKTCGAPAGKGNCTGIMGCFNTCLSAKKDANGLLCAIGCLTPAAPAEADKFADLMICSNDCDTECDGKKDEDACTKTCNESKCKKFSDACPAPKT